MAAFRVCGVLGLCDSVCSARPDGAASGSHAQALDAEFIHRFGIAGPLDEARERLTAVRDLGIDFVRVIPGSRGAPSEVTLPSIAAISTLVDEFASADPLPDKAG